MTSAEFFPRVVRKLQWWAIRCYWGGLYGALVHPLRERRNRRPDPAYAAELGKATTPEMVRLLDTLNRDGIVVLPCYFRGDRLHRLQNEFEEMCMTIQNLGESPEQLFYPSMFGPYKEYAYRDPDCNATLTYNPYSFCSSLLEISLDPLLTGIVERYFGKPVMLSEAIASRYYPMEPKDFLSWRWHSDGLGKRINAMFLFTDVGDRDQYMNYLKGSHTLIHRYPHHGGTSRFTNEEVKRKHARLENLKCLGPAGTVFLFDSNGIHRGNRSMGATRDTLIASYCNGSEITKLPVLRSSYDALTEAQRTFFRRNPRMEILG